MGRSTVQGKGEVENADYNLKWCDLLLNSPGILKFHNDVVWFKGFSFIVLGCVSPGRGIPGAKYL